MEEIIEKRGKLTSKYASEKDCSFGWVIVLVVAVSLLFAASRSMAAPEPEITVSSDSLFQGDAGYVRIRTGNGVSPKVEWLDQGLFTAAFNNGKRWFGFFAADLKLKPGSYPLVVKIPSTGVKKQFDIAVRVKDFGVRNLTLPKEQVDLDAVTLERVKKEAAVMKEALDAPPTAPQWKGPFLKPLNGEVVGTFGQASIINGMPRSPHSGVDLKAEKGTPVISINSGRVVLTGDHFFNGLFVVVDHGGAVQSMYFHLDKISVQQGDTVAKGQVVGLVGATGRATGPHLHFGIRINGARIDPLQFIKVNEAMERL